MRLAFDDKLELAGEDVDDLFMRMLVFGKRRAGIDVDPRMRHAVGVNEPRTQTRENLSNRQGRKVNKRHLSIVNSFPPVENS